MKDGYLLCHGQAGDLPLWMALVELVRDNFPGLESQEELARHAQIVEKNMGRGSAICVKHGDAIVGVLLFSCNQSRLGCMVVHPDHRRRGIASAMIEKMLSLLPADRDVWVSTFREGDEKDVGARALYKSFGFVEGELTIEHGHPNQRFILHRG